MRIKRGWGFELREEVPLRSGPRLQLGCRTFTTVSNLVSVVYNRRVPFNNLNTTLFQKSEGVGVRNVTVGMSRILGGSSPDYTRPMTWYP